MTFSVVSNRPLSCGRFLWWEWEGDDIGNIVTYSRENADMLAIAYANGQETKGNYKYRSMKDEEVDIYNYLLGKGWEDKANEFLSFMDEELNAREGKGLAKRITGIDIPAVEDLAIVLYGLGAGIDQWASGTRQLFTNELHPTTVEQYANSEIANSLDGIGKYAYTGANVIGNMAPSILLSYVTAGLGAPAAAAQGVGAAAVGMSAAGNAYGSALADGYSVGQARAYSTLVGVAEGTLQYILGGIGSLGGITDDLIKVKINMIDKSLLRIGAKLGVDILSEISEEELQNFLEPAFRSIIFGEEYDAPTIDEMLETAIVTAGTTFLLGGSGTISNDLSANKLLNATAQIANEQTNTPYNQEDIAKRLMDKDFNPEKSANMAEVIAARLNGQELTKTQTGRLRAAMDNAVVRDVIYDITKEKAEGIDSTQNNGYDKIGDSEHGHVPVTEDAAPRYDRDVASGDRYEGGSKTVINSTPELEAHVKYVDPSVPRKRGIGGAHNSQEFFKNDVEIVSEMPSKMPGVKTVEYRMPKLNADGTPTGEYGARVFKKTIYDPEVINDNDFIKRGLEAANDAISKAGDGVMPREWSGVDSEGVTWRGYFEDGEITSFFPEE